LLHMLRVFFTGAFHPPRRFNWIVGLALFFAVLTSNFTGYLLPWDQLAFWAVTICTGMLEYIPWVGTTLQRLIRGGMEVGPETLSHFFAIHVMIMPVCFFILMPFHFWRVRKARGVVLPRSENPGALSRESMVPVNPNLLIREVAVGLSLMAFVMVVSVFFDAPLGDPANLGLSPNPTKAPWYFAGFQELLVHFDPMFVIMVIPILLIGGAIAIPYLRYEQDTSGIWFCSAAGRKRVLIAAAGALIATALAVIFDELIITDAAWLADMPGVWARGVIPVALVLGLLTGLYIWMRRKMGISSNEAVQTFVTFLFAALVVLTGVCVWFRGPGMKLGF
ncbi:MAG: cytochrome b N-terminal domain-containing protein, partial [Deltaproteobacteria bacterium]|nr:cytochrome b N-terminal domain-containing protein [Deltaproteobacteria bacterium]